MANLPDLKRAMSSVWEAVGAQENMQLQHKVHLDIHSLDSVQCSTVPVVVAQFQRMTKPSPSDEMKIDMEIRET